MPPPFFDSNRTRQINLGGSTTTTSHASILDGVKARRNQKLDAQRRAESALRIQAWYRGRSQARHVRAKLRAEFDAGNKGIAWTRCLVAACSTQDQERLGRWSNIMKDRGRFLLLMVSNPLFNYVARRATFPLQWPGPNDLADYNQAGPSSDLEISRTASRVSCTSYHQVHI